ncbi:Auxin_inducible domain-containing protein, partial [Cephalotus follicularis]
LLFTILGMDLLKKKWKKNLIFKTWDRRRSVGSSIHNSPGEISFNSLAKSNSWPSLTRTSSDGDQKPKSKCQVAPDGCFTVYVGPQKQRFIIRTQFVNHPLFKMLLEDAELEYGFNSEGPILLPCDVDLFYKVLADMDNEAEMSPGCGGGYSSLLTFSPSRRSNNGLNKEIGSYSLLSPSRKLNRYISL